MLQLYIHVCFIDWMTPCCHRHVVPFSPCTASLSTVEDEKKKSEDFVVQKSDILCSNTGRYLLQDFTDEGHTSKVAKCVNIITSQEVALKILKTEYNVVANREVDHLINFVNYVFWQVFCELN